MTKISETIVFFGSGPVAAKSLELLSEDFKIEAVITKPAKSRPNDPVPVVDLANKLGLKVFLASTKTELDKIFDDKLIKSKLAILVDYGIIVSQNVIDYFPFGIINSHFSLLPKWRGADPITFSILNGDTETGISLMLLDAKMDEGKLLYQAKRKLLGTESSIDLTYDLVNMSYILLVDIVPKYLDGRVKPYAQGKNPTYSRKLTKEDGLINWRKPADVIEREIRAYIEWPKSYTKIKDKDIIITKAHKEYMSGRTGNFITTVNELIFYCGKDALSVDRLKPSGKNEMGVKAFLAGYRSILE